jgi:hypothetical protein
VCGVVDARKGSLSPFAARKVVFPRCEKQHTTPAGIDPDHREPQSPHESHLKTGAFESIAGAFSSPF